MVGTLTEKKNVMWGYGKEMTWGCVLLLVVCSTWGGGSVVLTFVVDKLRYIYARDIRRRMLPIESYVSC